MTLRQTLILSGAVVLAALVAPVVTAAPLPGMHSSTMPPQQLTMVLHPSTAMAHGEHVSMPNFAVEPGLPVQLTVTNYTHRFHTFTVAGLGLSKLILPARGGKPTTTTITFTVPRFGVFEWACLLCPDGARDTQAMHGKVYATVQV